MKFLFLSSVVVLPFQRLSGFRMFSFKSGAALTRPSGQGSASEARNLEPPLRRKAVLRAFTPPTTNFIGDRRSPEKFGASLTQYRHFTNYLSSPTLLSQQRIKMYNNDYNNDYNDSPSYDNHKKPFFGQGSASEARNLEPPLRRKAVLRAFTPPTTNFKGDHRSPEKFGNNRKKKVRQDKLEAGRHKSQYAPRGFNQCRYVDFLKDPSVSIVVGVGPAGCGKTLFACHTAIQELKYGNIEKIVMTRPLVSVDKEDLGFLPGTIVNKMDPWTRPIFDIFSEFYSQNEIEYMIKTGVIEISPLAYMRGRTFKYSFIIADEMQNSSPNQMLMMTTRIGEGSKMAITGDLKQSDTNTNMAENGLYDFIQKIQSFNGTNDDIRLVEMENTDIERSSVVIKVLEMYGMFSEAVGGGKLTDDVANAESSEPK